MNTAESRLKETMFIVEATSFERHMLWETNHTKVKWEQIYDGWLVTVGKLDDRPCCIDTSWARINGQLVMFYEQCSQVTDCLQTDAWLDDHFNGTWDNGHRRARTDAQNFHLCLNAIRDANNPEAL
jgi:hypothetical protein